MLNGLGEGEFDPNSEDLRKLIAKGPRESDYEDTSQWDDLYSNTPSSPTTATTPAAPASAAPKPVKTTKTVDGQLVAADLLRKGVRPAADMDTKAWKLACRALGMRAADGAGCAKPEMVIDETCTQSRKIVFGQELTASDRDKVARALRGGGYNVEIK